MKKILITALAVLFMFTACNLEGEKPLEEGVMTTEEFFEEIEVSDPAKLVDGWWYLNQGVCFRIDEHGNYKQFTLYATPVFDYYFHLSNGLVTEVKRYCYVQKGGWEDVAIDDPNGIKIDKPERKFSFNIIYSQHYLDHRKINNEDIVQCMNNKIMTINLGLVIQDESGNDFYSGNCFKHIGNELPTEWKPSNDDK